MQPQNTNYNSVLPSTSPPFSRIPPVAGTSPADSAKICQLLESLPVRIWDTLRLRGDVRPREAFDFISSGTQDVTPGAVVGAGNVIASYTMTDKQTGFLKRMKINVSPVGETPNMTFSLRLGNTILTGFSAVNFPIGSLDNWIESQYELTQNKTIELLAYKTVGGVTTVGATLQGWQEYLSTNKKFGTGSALGM